MSETLETVEVDTGSSPRVSVIWLHGLGADGHDFEPIVPEMDLPDDVAIRFVFPHAPMRPVAVNNGMVMRAWYDISLAGGKRQEDEPGVRESERQIRALIEREGKRGVPATATFLFGFSQGGAMALQTGLRYPERLGGIAALSCALPLADKLAAEASPANRDLPIFMAHGAQDPMIPLSRGAEARDRLIALGYRAEWHEYRMPHSVCAEEIADLSAWLRGSLARPS
jgi:phospholipase/carboxylesterase